jgi:hypothetical protein
MLLNQVLKNSEDGAQKISLIKGKSKQAKTGSGVSMISSIERKHIDQVHSARPELIAQF